MNNFRLDTESLTTGEMELFDLTSQHAIAGRVKGMALPPLEVVNRRIEPDTIKAGRFEFLGQGPDKGILIDGVKTDLKVRGFDIRWRAGDLVTVTMDVIIDERFK